MKHANRHEVAEKVFWSIALPGFGQLLNGKLFKGFLFIALEILVNVQANFNQIIILSFNRKIRESIEQTNYQWLMFYPCIYMFAIWDAYKDAGGGKDRYSFLPFVFGAYFVTLGLIYSPCLKVFGVLLGPMWLPMLSLPIGLALGVMIKKIVERFINST
ncbi:hypothetical protein [Peribacillus glennii]|uniref:Uncharacterized protein n=1 Tax=Peribacillus glennii TaxID=2303991 RepID=A0A372LJN6_9BACI|nr:hypothetical protein [Peribacillus glennii]RFU66692.1 hypothetical protein D0466_00835 [Peribacillus glennii]